MSKFVEEPGIIADFVVLAGREAYCLGKRSDVEERVEAVL